MLCCDSQLRNSSVFIHFHSDNSAAASNATCKYGTVPERPSINEEATSRNEQQTRNRPSSYLVLPENFIGEFICILPVLEHETFSYLAHFFYFHRN